MPDENGNPYHPVGYFRIRNIRDGRVMAVVKTAEEAKQLATGYAESGAFCDAPERITEENKNKGAG